MNNYQYRPSRVNTRCSGFAEEKMKLKMKLKERTRKNAEKTAMNGHSPHAVLAPGFQERP
jgi:hypothetical protein